MRLENVETKMPAHFNMCSCAFIIKRDTDNRVIAIKKATKRARGRNRVPNELTNVRVHVITALVWLLDSAFWQWFCVQHFPWLFYCANILCDCMARMCTCVQKCTIHIEISLWSANSMKFSSAIR